MSCFFLNLKLFIWKFQSLDVQNIICAYQLFFPQVNFRNFFGSRSARNLPSRATEPKKKTLLVLLSFCSYTYIIKIDIPEPGNSRNAFFQNSSLLGEIPLCFSKGISTNSCTLSLSRAFAALRMDLKLLWPFSTPPNYLRLGLKKVGNEAGY